MVAFDARAPSGRRQIWVRAMDQVEGRLLAGSEGAVRPFWSPDSRFVAFVADGKLRKIDVAGGLPQTICDAPAGSDGSWGSEGVILFDQQDGTIWRVPATGGVARIEVEADAARDVTGAEWPEFLPDGRHFLYVGSGRGPEDRRLVVKALGDNNERELLKTLSSRALYSPPGYLLYVRWRTLVAQPFDAKSQEVKGEPMPIAEGFGTYNVGLASFSTSDTGTLAYRAVELDSRQLLWFDRSGKETPALAEPGQYRDAWLSPDGKRLAFSMSKGSENSDIWIRDVARDVTSRFTFDAGMETDPVWSPDGRSLVYSAGPGRRNMDLMIKDTAGTREAEVLLKSDESKFASEWSRDGKYLLYSSQSKQNDIDLWALPMTGERRPIPVSKTRFTDFHGSFSPDARYVTYFSNESGQMEVYVQEFPEARDRWQVSTQGGTYPFWSGTGREIFYRAPDDSVMAVPVRTMDGFAAGTPKALFKGRFANVTVRAHYRPALDGQRFLILAPLRDEKLPATTVVLNWPAGIR